MNSLDVSLDATRREEIRDDLACPRCMGSLKDSGTELSCAGCGAVYAVRDGITDLRSNRYDYYFNPLPRKEMEALTLAAETQPWEDTIRRFLDGVNHHPEWFDDLVVDGRYAWKLLLRLSEDARVLDIGCGLGNLVKNVAPHVRRVDALDLTLERLKFARTRFKHFNRGQCINLVAGGDGTYLPFPGGSFDCVTLSGVLEWVAEDDGIWDRGGTRATRAIRAVSSFFGKTNPRATQRRFLEEIRRVLKPDGQLFIAIENRLSYTYFGGRPDHHSSLWFGSLLPRFVANLYSIVVRHSPYRTYTYSISGLRRLFRSAGFRDMEFFGLTPGYTELAELIPLQKADRLWRPSAPRGADRIRRNRHLVPAYGAIASPTAPKRSSLAEQLASSLAGRLGVDASAMRFTRFEVTNKNKGIIHAEAEGRPIVLKLPFNTAIAERASIGYDFLERASTRPELRGRVPRPLGTDEIRGIRYYAEEQVSGSPLKRVLDADNRLAWFDAAAGFLDALNPGLPEQAATPMSGELYRREVSDPLRRVGRFIAPALAERLGHFFSSQLEQVAVRTGIVHGDFGANNVFVRGGAITGVIDWDDISLSGVPALDAINLVHSLRRDVRHRGRDAGSIVELADPGTLAEEERKFLVGRYQRSGLDIDHHHALVGFYWLRHVADQLDGDLVYDRPAIDKRVAAVFEKLLDRAGRR